MKLEDLDDHAPIEPDDGLLATVHARSHSFRRRRTTQRFTTATAGLVVVSLVVGIALTRTDTSANRKIQLPAASITTPISQATIKGKWIPVSVTGYDGALSKPPLSSVPHLSFDGDDRWSASDGCNDLGGTYRVEENGIHFLTFGGTLVGCHGTPDFEPIESAPRSEIRDDQLTFLDSDGKELARFARSGITAQVELPATTMTAGSTMNAQVVVDNNTGHEIHATMCGSFFQVELRHGKDSSAGIWTQCAVPFTFPAGQSRYRVSVQASYGMCAAGSPGIPTCLPTGTRPLPPGEYQANLLQSSPIVSVPLPIDVTVTAPGTTNTAAPASVTEDAIAGPWLAYTIAGYGYIKKGPLNRPALNSDPSLSFDGRGRWSGSDGCNQLSGGYQLDGNGVRFASRTVTTTMNCGADVPDFGQIEKAPRSEIRGNEMTFFASNGIEIARFVRESVTARIELPSATMVKGSTMSGHVVIDNNTGHEIHAGGCGSLFAVMLGNAAYHPDPVWPLCGQDIVMPVGETSYKAQVLATYDACDQTGTNGIPRCLPGNTAPPLPTGDYQARFFQSSPVVTPALPIDVTVIAQ